MVQRVHIPPTVVTRWGLSKTSSGRKPSVAVGDVQGGGGDLRCEINLKKSKTPRLGMMRQASSPRQKRMERGMPDERANQFAEKLIRLTIWSTQPKKDVDGRSNLPRQLQLVRGGGGTRRNRRKEGRNSNSQPYPIHCDQQDGRNLKCKKK